YGLSNSRDSFVLLGGDLNSCYDIAILEQDIHKEENKPYGHNFPHMKLKRSII
ncbi:hypothetical protein ACJX0J_033548, partial [Zea mays]